MSNHHNRKDDDPFIETFAKRVGELRVQTQYSARDLSLRLGQSHNYINNIELCKNYPSMPGFLHLCEELRVTPSEFFDYTNENPHIDNELYKEIKRMDIRSQQLLLSFIQNLNLKHK